MLIPLSLVQSVSSSSSPDYRRLLLAYNELGIGRLIHQLPSSLCEMFLNEVFAGNTDTQFEDEELITVRMRFLR